MTYLEAAVKVLRASGRAMTIEEILAEAVSRRLLWPNGKTPEATMSAALYRYVRDAQDPQIERQSAPGPTRAHRGSVAWSFKSG
jgi:hypothetical protein